MKKRHRKEFCLLLAWLAAIAAGLSSCTEGPANGKPNILFIMADDHTTQAISCYQGIFAGKARTVNIDQIAAEGMRFTNVFCTNAICSPAGPPS